MEEKEKKVTPEEEKKEKVEAEVVEEKAASTEEPKPAFKTIKLWIQLGVILTPLIGVLQGFAFSYRWFSLFYLLGYAVTIPIGMFGLKKLCTAKSKQEVISWGVLTLIFASLPGGIMMLMTNDAFFETFDHRKDDNLFKF